MTPSDVYAVLKKCPDFEDYYKKKLIDKKISYDPPLDYVIPLYIENRCYMPSKKDCEWLEFEETSKGDFWNIDELIDILNEYRDWSIDTISNNYIYLSKTKPLTDEEYAKQVIDDIVQYIWVYNIHRIYRIECLENKLKEYE